VCCGVMRGDDTGYVTGALFCEGLTPVTTPVSMILIFFLNFFNFFFKLFLNFI